MSDPEMTTFGMYQEPEPVAWFCKLPDNKISIKIAGKPTEGNWEPLYAAPPKKEWVGLTDEEINTLHYELKCAAMGATSTLGMYRILEKALKEKST